MKVFVDTNILIDLVCSREDFIDDAQRLFALGFAHRIDIAMSALSYVNTMYIGRKYGFAKNDLVDILSKIAAFTETSDLSDDVVMWALKSEWKDFEDATQYKVAISAKSDCIVTRNKDDFKLSAIPVYTANELFETL